MAVLVALALAVVATIGVVNIVQTLHASPLAEGQAGGSPDTPELDGTYGIGRYVVDAPKGAQRTIAFSIRNAGHATVTVDGFDSVAGFTDGYVGDLDTDRNIAYTVKHATAGTKIAAGHDALFVLQFAGRGCYAPESLQGLDSVHVRFRVRGVHREQDVPLGTPVVIVGDPGAGEQPDPKHCVSVS